MIPATGVCASPCHRAVTVGRYDARGRIHPAELQRQFSSFVWRLRAPFFCGALMAFPPSYDEWQAQQAHAEARRRHPLRLVLVFLVAFFALQHAWSLCRGTALERLVIDQGTVMPAAALIRTLGARQNVVADGHSLVAPGARLNVINGCEGLETVFLLVAAFVSYPLSWTRRAVGVMLGTVLVYTLNQLRLVLLWHAWLSDRGIFGLLHGTVLPLALIAMCLVYFLWFLRRNSDPSIP